ncbi:MAG: serine--tRNA ligase [Candidatus Dojkabacteria bacterium]
MLDPNFIRKNTETIKKIIAAGRSNPEKANIDRWIELDSKRSELISQRDEKREIRNELSKGLKGKPDPEIIEKVRQIKAELEPIEEELKQIETEWQAILDWIPNMPVSEEAMPFGTGEEHNLIDKVWVVGKGYVYEKSENNNTITAGSFNIKMLPERSPHWDEALEKPVHHLELGTELGIIDQEQSAKVSGSRFTYLIGDAVLLQYALQQMMYEELLKRGFTPIIPPLLVKDRALYGTSHFPEGRDQVYAIKGDYVEEGTELNLVGSSEPANFSLFMDKTLEEESLPRKVFAYTPCFRSEVGSWGKDVRGIKRLHQFDKIEMNVVCTPEQSKDIFNELLEINEWVWQQLEISYRLARKCTGDAGYHASAEQVDSEVWLPGQKELIEVGTDTNTTDFQARRLNIKYQTKNGEKNLCHTVNDTGIAMGRTLIAIIDNYQQSDGSIKIPKVLQKYMGKEFIRKQ